MVCLTFLGEIRKNLPSALTIIDYVFSAPFFAFTPPCFLKMRLGANSPNLWPTIFSVIKTGICFLPSCTAKVNPTKSGTTVERRDQVFIAWQVPARFNLSTLRNNLSSTNGPFFSERGILFPSLQNKL